MEGENRVRGDPERNEIAGFGNFVFVLGGSPLERAEGLAPKPAKRGGPRLRPDVCLREGLLPEGPETRFSAARGGRPMRPSKARPRHCGRAPASGLVAARRSGIASVQEDAMAHAVL